MLFANVLLQLRHSQIVLACCRLLVVALDECVNGLPEKPALHVAIWDRDFASPEERKIAKEINRKVGYEVNPESISGQRLEVSYAL